MRGPRETGPAIAFILASFISSVQAKELPFSLESIRTSDGHTIVAHNRGAAPISAIVSILESENLGSNQNWPIISVIPPFSDKIIGSVYPRDLSYSYRFSTSAKARAGIVGAIPDASAQYRLPYLDGRAFVMGQAPGGKITTHNTSESQYAIDFTMPEGTLILAARSGTVIEVEDNFIEGGKESRLMAQANDVQILHQDGTVATYAHLMPGGVSVKPGQQVQTGDLIGYAGSTGYSSGPHLHFVVSRVVSTGGDLSEESLPITFFVGSPPVSFLPQQGMKALANYSGIVNPNEIEGRIQLASNLQDETTKLSGQFKPTSTEGLPLPEAGQFRIVNWGWLAGVLVVFLIIVARGIHHEKQREMKKLHQLRQSGWND